MLLGRPPLPRVRRRRVLLFPRRRLAANQSRVPVPPVRSLHTVCPSEAVISPGAGPNLRLIERFWRTTAGTLHYEYTVHDPESFASAWTATFPFTRDPGPVYHFECHEGNHSMPLILSGARAKEREAAASR